MEKRKKDACLSSEKGPAEKSHNRKREVVPWARGKKEGGPYRLVGSPAEEEECAIWLTKGKRNSSFPGRTRLAGSSSSREREKSIWGKGLRGVAGPRKKTTVPEKRGMSVHPASERDLAERRRSRKRTCCKREEGAGIRQKDRPIRGGKRKEWVFARRQEKKREKAKIRL